MKKQILQLILIITVGGWVGPAIAEPKDGNYYEVWKQISPSIVGLTCTLDNAKFHGTGAIIKSDGLMLTTSSVIPPKAKDILVRLNNGKSYKGKIVFTDEPNEVTLLDIEADNLISLNLGDSDKVKIGDAAYTLGDSLSSIINDDQPAFSRGIISGRYSLEKEGAYHLEEITGKYIGEVIETTAAVNGGIDGGPLISADGEIIGIIILSYSKSRRLGTALPSNIIKSSIKEYFSPPEQSAGKLPDPVSFNYLLDKVKPFIVGLRITYEEKSQPPEPPPRRQPDPMEPPTPETSAEIKEYSTRPDSLLSGILVDPAKGYVLTSYHHIAGKLKEVKVIKQTDKSKKEYPAKVVGWCQDFDLALLKTEEAMTGEDLRLPDQTNLKVGQWAIIIGNNPDPTAFETTMTAGIVSALNRLINGKAFQLDAKINYGNIGGAVFDLDGNFIGLVGQFAHPLEWGLNSGVGLAVKSTAIKEILPDLIAGKKIEKTPLPFLGVQLVSGALDVKGAKIDQVIPDSAAEKAGIKVGDVIIQLNNKSVTESRELINMIRTYKVKEKVKIKIQREDKTIEVEAVLEQR